MLSDDSTVEGLKVLYRKLLRHVETVCDADRMEPFGEAYLCCRQDFGSLLQGRLKDFGSALSPSEI